MSKSGRAENVASVDVAAGRSPGAVELCDAPIFYMKRKHHLHWAGVEDIKG